VPIAVTEIPETGRRLHLIADERARAGIARHAGVPAVPRLEAAFELTRRGRHGVRVVGTVSATVEQVCVVTLEPMSNEVDEEVDLVFLPGGATMASGDQSEDNASTDEPPEVLRDGSIDLGAITTEFLILGIDPYPRKAGSVFEAPKPAAGGTNRPFARLAALKKNKPGREER
jgi:uncharacterized metal-binding protein YceD (DUF177 family)